MANLWGQTCAFVALERIGGIMIYDISNQRAPRFVQYLNRRDFTAAPGTPATSAPRASW